VPNCKGISERSDLRGALQLGAHGACIAATALLVWGALPFWYLLVPAMAVHGITIVTLFAPMHECVHRTAFASRTANLIVGWIAGVLSFYNSTHYRHYHSWHHRYRQDPARDPELMFPKTRTYVEYITEISAVMFRVRRACGYAVHRLPTPRSLAHPGHTESRARVSISARPPTRQPERSRGLAAARSAAGAHRPGGPRRDRPSTA
jgi:fatty acid desaturase